MLNIDFEDGSNIELDRDGDLIFIETYGSSGCDEIVSLTDVKVKAFIKTLQGYSRGEILDD